MRTQPRTEGARKSSGLSGFNQRKCLKCKKRHNECNCLRDELALNRRGQAHLFKSAHVDKEENEFWIWAWYVAFGITSPCPDDLNAYHGDF